MFCIKYTKKLAVLQIFYLAFSMLVIIIDRLELRIQNCLTKRIVNIRGCILDTWKDSVFFVILLFFLLCSLCTLLQVRTLGVAVEE
jgi:hypothetical protein